MNNPSGSDNDEDDNNSVENDDDDDEYERKLRRMTKYKLLVHEQHPHISHCILHGAIRSAGEVLHGGCVNNVIYCHSKKGAENLYKDNVHGFTLATREGAEYQHYLTNSDNNINKV